MPGIWLTATRKFMLDGCGAGVERNAIVGDDAERRKRQIPIVQLVGALLQLPLSARSYCEGQYFP